MITTGLKLDMLESPIGNTDAVLQRWRPNRISLERIKGWLQNCDSTHELFHRTTTNVSESHEQYYENLEFLTVTAGASALLQESALLLHSLPFGVSHWKLVKQELAYQNSSLEPSKTASNLQSCLAISIFGLITTYVGYSHTTSL
jgi:hypothetical protein